VLFLLKLRCVAPIIKSFAELLQLGIGIDTGSTSATATATTKLVCSSLVKAWVFPRNRNTSGWQKLSDVHRVKVSEVVLHIKIVHRIPGCETHIGGVDRVEMDKVPTMVGVVVVTATRTLTTSWHHGQTTRGAKLGCPLDLLHNTRTGIATSKVQHVTGMLGDKTRVLCMKSFLCHLVCRGRRKSFGLLELGVHGCLVLKHLRCGILVNPVFINQQKPPVGVTAEVKEKVLADVVSEVGLTSITPTAGTHGMVILVEARFDNHWKPIANECIVVISRSVIWTNSDPLCFKLSLNTQALGHCTEIVCFGVDDACRRKLRGRIKIPHMMQTTLLGDGS
jgi:hypothetical protein